MINVHGKDEDLDSVKALKQARLDRLNAKVDIARPRSNEKFVAALQKIDRWCSTRFGQAVVAGRIHKTDDDVIDFAKLPGVLMGQADLAGVHDQASLQEFVAKHAPVTPVNT